VRLLNTHVPAVLAEDGLDVKAVSANRRSFRLDEPANAPPSIRRGDASSTAAAAGHDFSALLFATDGGHLIEWE